MSGFSDLRALEFDASLLLAQIVGLEKKLRAHGRESDARSIGKMKVKGAALVAALALSQPSALRRWRNQ